MKMYLYNIHIYVDKHPLFSIYSPQPLEYLSIQQIYVGWVYDIYYLCYALQRLRSHAQCVSGLMALWCDVHRGNEAVCEQNRCVYIEDDVRRRRWHIIATRWHCVSYPTNLYSIIIELISAFKTVRVYAPTVSPEKAIALYLSWFGFMILSIIFFRGW